MAKIVLCGYMIRHPVPGNMLAFYQYLQGLRQLGHAVTYLETSGWPGACFDPATGLFTDDPAPGMARLMRMLREDGLDDVPVLYVAQESGRECSGDVSRAAEVAREADLLLNVGGVCWMEEFLLCRRRALVDMDPLFTQLGKFGREADSRYHTCFTYGTNINGPDCTIPSMGIHWHPTVPPVVVERWTGREGWRGGVSAAAYTTIANWSAYGTVEHNGVRYGQKDVEFERLIDLPRRTDARLELAISGAAAEVQARLRTAGWCVRAAADISKDLRAYASYIMDSRGEFSAAKHAYVSTRSGWISDRTVCYLAGGRPAVVQETGASSWLDTSAGCLTFGTLEEAIEQLAAVEGRYDWHARAAADLARRVFDYRVVLPHLLDVALSK